MTQAAVTDTIRGGNPMRRRIGVTVLLAWAMIAAVGTGAASAACPNEAFRTGPSALLPECRAYEMVTPVDKESGAGVFDSGGARVTPSGDGIYFSSQAAYAGARGNQYFNPYVARRSAAGWATSGVGGPQAVQNNPTIATTWGVDDALGLTFMASKEALAPGAIPYGSNLYVHDLRTDTYTTVAAFPGNEDFENWGVNGQTQIPFGAADADWSRILFSSPHVLTPDAAAGQRHLYELSQGRVGLVANEAEVAGRTEATPNTISVDGSRVYYRGGEVIYTQQVGQETPVLVTEFEGNVIPGNFVGATPSGDVAFFRNGGGAYRFEPAAPAGSRVTRLTPAEGLEGMQARVLGAWSGEDGGSAYIAAASRLTADALPVTEPNPGQPDSFDLYAWHGAPGQAGGLRYIGQVKPSISGEIEGPRTVGVSPDGRFFGFESFGKATPDAVGGSAQSCPREPFQGSPEGRCANVFLYSYDANRLACVSCSGAPPVGDSRLGGREERVETVFAPTAVLDDGTIFFDTPNTLVPTDVNGVRDAYAWRAGAPMLISTGTDYDPSSFIDATVDGSDVFFATRQQLVGQDVDPIVDLYDARVDGGLPQGAPVSSPSCANESACRPGIEPGASSGQIGTGTVGDASRGADACLSVQGKAGVAGRRSKVLAHRARRAEGSRARALRRDAAREAKAAKRLVRRARNCTGGAR